MQLHGNQLQLQVLLSCNFVRCNITRTVMEALHMSRSRNVCRVLLHMHGIRVAKRVPGLVSSVVATITVTTNAITAAVAGTIAGTTDFTALHRLLLAPAGICELLHKIVHEQ